MSVIQDAVSLLRVQKTGSRPRWERHLARAATALAMVAIAAVVLAAVGPGLFTSASPTDNDLTSVMVPPSAAHPFGTDQLGRDVYARVIHGASISLKIGLLAVVCALAAGVLLGALAGLLPGVAGAAATRALDVLAAFPMLLLTLVVLSILGRGTDQLIVALSIGSFAEYARLVRAQVVTVRRRGYIEAARELGMSPVVVAVRHILPNSLGPVLAVATVGVGTTILVSSSMSFLGFGPPPPAPEWGAMLAEGRTNAFTAWWVVVFPGLAITAVVVTITAIGRSFQRLDDRSHR